MRETLKYQNSKRKYLTEIFNLIGCVVFTERPFILETRENIL